MDKKILIMVIVATIVIVLAALIYVVYIQGGKITINTEQTPTASNEEDGTTNMYSLEEVAQHGSESSCWQAINGKVYDVTPFISFHPGGQLILNGCGKDATVLFETRPTNPETPHPESAIEKLKDYYIGDLQP
ncbi:MAG: cytochrome b5-like heme/steroid binding domain-containing protein [Candidatus Colwellbacteria bacterium]|nr:cytochrome b5-like heme/steroid binding domain-containing protein [Candidatus Colwellbacteria bacterium]